MYAFLYLQLNYSVHVSDICRYMYSVGIYTRHVTLAEFPARRRLFPATAAPKTIKQQDERAKSSVPCLFSASHSSLGSSPLEHADSTQSGPWGLTSVRIRPFERA